MSKIIAYDFSTVQKFMEAEVLAYDKQITQMLTFEDWKCRAFPNLLENPKKFNVTPYKYGTPIRISPTGLQMMHIIDEHQRELQDIEFNCPKEQQDFRKTQLLKQLFKPVKEFVIDKPIYIEGCTSEGVATQVPIWFDTTVDAVNVRPGFANLDSSRPATFPLSDQVVHAMAGGRTGAGKSVLLNDIIVTLLLEYAPWELDLMLADFKIVELSRYGNRFPTPHVSVIAATSSTEFALSVFNYMVDEMNARQAVFTAAGVTNLKGFRKKFDLVMPRTVLIADEFVQMYENVKLSESAGNDKADEQKKAINMAISAVSRLGRSMGMHMLLSSQNMEGQLDDQTAGQFAGGITLGATASVSNSLIGNPAGALLEGKGKAYMNLNKVGKRPDQNVLCWVPFIQDSVSDEEAARGKLSYLQEVLKICCDKAEEYNWDRKPFMYNEREPLAYQEFVEQCRFARNLFDNPQEGSEIKNQIYKDITIACLPLGREVVYKENPVAVLHLKRRPRNNLIVAAQDELTKLYMLKLLATGFKMYPVKHFMISADISVSRQLGFDSILKDFTESPKAAIPKKYFDMVKSRSELLKLQMTFLDAGIKRCWDDKLAYDFCLSSLPQTVVRGANLGIVNRLVQSYEYDIISLRSVEGIKNAAEASGFNLGSTEVDLMAQLLVKLSKLKNTILALTKDVNAVLTAAMFSQIVIWWIGADQIEGADEYESRAAVKAFFNECCQVGIFNIVSADKWGNLSALSAGCNYVLERCSKDFFLNVELPRNININMNSFQLHDRDEKSRAIIRLFSM